MLRMMSLGLLIPLGVGVLSAMELSAPPRSAVAVVQPLAETTIDIPDLHRALAKADRLERVGRLEIVAASSEKVAAVSNETPVQPALVNEPIAPPQGISTAASEPPTPVKRHWHDPKPKKATVAARPKPKPKAVQIKSRDNKRTVVSRRPMAVSDTEPCRLSAFGGLRRALNSVDCEI